MLPRYSLPVINIVASQLISRLRPPCSCRAGEQRDERASSHSISSSASNWIELGTSMPSALAVCMLITNSNLVDCKTGRSAGVCTFEDMSSVDPHLAKHVRTVGRVAHQPTGFDSLARGIA